MPPFLLRGILSNLDAERKLHPLADFGRQRTDLLHGREGEIAVGIRKLEVLADLLAHQVLRDARLRGEDALLEVVVPLTEDGPGLLAFIRRDDDLSENAEYQYANDEQRALMQKQTLMQADLEAVKPGDFADATTDEVMPGVTVVIAAKDGEKTWTILGEWDNDIEKGILSSKTRVAQNMLGKKVGEDFELPDADGNLTFATVREIRPLSAEIKDWMKLPAGVQI